MKNDLKKISEYLIFYRSSGSHKYLIEIEKYLKEYFSADGIVFWTYQTDTDSINMLSETKHKALPLSSSLIKQSIETKSSMFLDHVSSNKFYSSSIDNPLDLKIRSMMIVPMIKDNKVLGIVSLYKEIKRRKKFTDYDGLMFQKFALTLLGLYSKETIEQKSQLNAKNHVLEALPREQEINEKKLNKKKESVSELELEIKALKNIFSDLEKENKSFKNELNLLKSKEKENITKLNQQNDKFEALEATHKSTVDKHKKENVEYKKSTKTYVSELTELKKLVKKQELDLKAYAKSDKEQKKCIDAYEKEIEELKHTEKEFQSVHKSIVIKYEKNELKQLNAIEEYRKTIEELKSNLSEKPKENKDNSKDENAYLAELNKVKEEVVYLNKEIEYFDSELKKLEKENENLAKIAEENKVSTEEKSKKDHKEIWLQKKDAKENYNIEYILQEVDSIFGVNEQAYMLFELMVFSINSTENMQLIENKIKSSKIVPLIVEEFKFENMLKIHKEKYLVSKFIDNIRGYEQTIFPSKIKLNITIDKFMPKFFIFDAPKVQSIVLHLLMDLQEFIDHKKSIDMSFTHNTKLLHIEIGGKLPQETGGFLSGLTKKNIVKDISKRPALQIGRKLLNSFDYDIEPVYKEKYYTFILDVPIEVL